MADSFARMRGGGDRLLMAENAEVSKRLIPPGAALGASATEANC